MGKYLHPDYISNYTCIHHVMQIILCKWYVPQMFASVYTYSYPMFISNTDIVIQNLQDESE